MNEFIFKLPDLGEGVVEGEIVAWHVGVGQAVAEDEPLVDVMTDKATVTISSVVGGKVLALQGKVGEMVAVGKELARIDPRETSVATSQVASIKMVSAAATKSSSKSASSTETPRPALVAPMASPKTAVQALAAKVGAAAPKPLASPAVRRRARQQGLDIRQVSGTGRDGRITDADLEAFKVGDPVTTQPAESVCATPLGTSEFPLTALRRRIAEKMTVSARHIPHFSYVEQIDITELSELREYLNEHSTNDAPRVTYLPFIMLALARSLRAHPHLNALFDEDRDVVTRYDAIHLGIATQTDRGLYVPVVRNVQDMDLWQTTTELKRVIQATQQYTIKREELSGSTCTISSLGPYGGLAATPIINHPEIAILGVNKAEDRPVVRNGQIVVRHIVNVSASFDHRVVDGADGIALVQTIKGYLEHPATMFL